MTEGTLTEQVLERLDTPFWIFDLDNLRKVWANSAGLAFWSATSLDELRSRDFSRDITVATLDKHQSYRQLFAENNNATIRECWTFYPAGRPNTIFIKIRPMRLSDGVLGILCEVERTADVAPHNVRAIDALTHSQAMIATYSSDGTLLFANPAARKHLPGGHQTLRERFIDAGQWSDLQAKVAAGLRFQDEIEVRLDTGPAWHHVCVEARHDPMTGEKGFLVTAADVTETRLARLLAESATTARAMAESRLWACIEELPDGIVMFDVDDRLVACNEKFKSLFPKVADRLVPGVSYEDMIGACVANGEIPDAKGREDEWLALRLLQHRFPSAPVDMTNGSGRHLRVTECRTNFGEYFAIFSDLTDQASTTAQVASLAQRLRLAQEDLHRRDQLMAEYAEKTYNAQRKLEAMQADLAQCQGLRGRG